MINLVLLYSSLFSFFECIQRKGLQFHDQPCSMIITFISFFFFSSILWKSNILKKKSYSIASTFTFFFLRIPREKFLIFMINTVLFIVLFFQRIQGKGAVLYLGVSLVNKIKIQCRTKTVEKQLVNCKHRREKTTAQSDVGFIVQRDLGFTVGFIVRYFIH